MINAHRIAELRNEVGEDGLIEILALFCEEVEEVIASLETAPRDQQPLHLHFLKGSAANIGLDAVSDLCRSEDLRLKQDAGALLDVSSIRSAYGKAKKALKAVL